MPLQLSVQCWLVWLSLWCVLSGTARAQNVAGDTLSVGVRGATPAVQTGLQVEPNGTVWSGTGTGFDSTSATPTGAGTRLMWVPEKNAFRAGRVLEAEPDRWDYARLGQNSFAWGNSNVASRSLATSWGESNLALGMGATVWGSHNEVYGDFATTWGIHNYATGYLATAFGDHSEAAGTCATSWGRDGSAIGELATAGEAATWIATRVRPRRDNIGGITINLPASTTKPGTTATRCSKSAWASARRQGQRFVTDESGSAHRLPHRPPRR